MKSSESSQQSRYSHFIFFGRLFFLSGAAALIGACLAVPYFFETMTLWYKVGTDRILLRSGHLAGMLALSLFYIQIILAVRGDLLSSLFSPLVLIRIHKITGFLILTLAFSHVLLVLVPEGLANLPMGKKFWPEMVGALVLLLVMITSLTTIFRQRLGISYQTWKRLHRFFGYSALLLLIVHVIFVSDAFEDPLLRGMVGLVTGAFILWIVVTKIIDSFT